MMCSLRFQTPSRTASTGIKLLAIVVLFNTAVLIWVVLKLTGTQPVNLPPAVPPVEKPSEALTPVTAQKPIQLPGSFAEATEGDAELAKRAAELDEQLARLNKLIEENARIGSGAKTSQPTVVPEDLQPSLEALQKWVKGGQKGPAPVIPLPKTEGVSRTPAGDKTPSWMERNRELVRTCTKVVGAAICLAQPELIPLVAMVAGVLEFASPESIADVVKMYEGIQGAILGRPFTPEQIRATGSVGSKLLGVPPTRVEKFVEGIQKTVLAKTPEERIAAVKDLVVMKPDNKNEYEAALQKLLKLDRVDPKDFDDLVARLPRNADGKHSISLARRDQLRRIFNSPADAKALAQVEQKLSVVQ